MFFLQDIFHLDVSTFFDLNDVFGDDLRSGTIVSHREQRFSKRQIQGTDFVTVTLQRFFMTADFQQNYDFPS